MGEDGGESQTELVQREHGGVGGEGAEDTIWEDRKYFLQKTKPKIRSDK